MSFNEILLDWILTGTKFKMLTKNKMENKVLVYSLSELHKYEDIDATFP